MTIPDDAFAAGMRIASALDRGQIPYAIGGALAYGQYGIPRVTHDVDVNIFLEPDQLAPVFEALAAEGIQIPAAGIEHAREEGLCVAHWGDMRIDLFTPSIPFSHEAQNTRKQFSIGGAQVWFLSAEAICVFKLLFFRGKDIADLERLVAVMGDTLDHAYVRTQIAEMMQEDDPRTQTWDRLVAEFGS